MESRFVTFSVSPVSKFCYRKFGVSGWALKIFTIKFNLFTQYKQQLFYCTYLHKLKIFKIINFQKLLVPGEITPYFQHVHIGIMWTTERWKERKPKVIKYWRIHMEWWKIGYNYYDFKILFYTDNNDRLLFYLKDIFKSEHEKK